MRMFQAFLILAVVVAAAVGTHGADIASAGSPIVPPDAWRGRLFNYQLIQKFNISSDVIRGVSVYFIDGFDNTNNTVHAMRVQKLLPVCYFSAGSFENWRPDAKQFNKSVIGKPLGEWPGEWWLDIRSKNVRDIMAARIKMCAEKGFVAIDPDNVDVHTQKSGFPLTANDTRSYLEFLATTAAGYGLGTGLKNAMGLIDPTTVQWFAFAVNEECFHWKECDRYSLFKKAKKPVYQIQYQEMSTMGDFFQQACAPGVQDSLGVTSIFKKQELKPRPWAACPAAVQAAIAALEAKGANATVVTGKGGAPKNGSASAAVGKTPAAGAAAAGGPPSGSKQSGSSSSSPGWWSAWSVGLLLLLGQMVLG